VSLQSVCLETSRKMGNKSEDGSEEALPMPMAGFINPAGNKLSLFLQLHICGTQLSTINLLLIPAWLSE